MTGLQRGVVARTASWSGCGGDIGDGLEEHTRASEAGSSWRLSSDRSQRAQGLEWPCDLSRTRNGAGTG